MNPRARALSLAVVVAFVSGAGCFAGAGVDAKLAGLVGAKDRDADSLEARYRRNILSRGQRQSEQAPPSTSQLQLGYLPYQPPLQVSLPAGSLLDGLFSFDGDPASGPSMPHIDEVWVVSRSALAMPAVASPMLPASLRSRDRDSKREISLPLRRTDVHARITGFAATVSVAQRFYNPARKKLTVEYRFPLPRSAAVTDFVVTIGGRTIRGFIRERAEAETLYREARRAGYVASLITKADESVFTQTVANIEPKKRVDVRLVYFQGLPYRNGAYSFAFPALNTRAPLTIAVDADTGVAMESVRSPSHRVDVQVLSPSRRKIRVRGNAASDRDFVLDLGIAGDRTKSVAMVEKSSRGAYFSVILQPPSSLGTLPRSRMEMIFVLDASRSMRGRALARARRIIGRALSQLRPSDTFQIVRLGSRRPALGHGMLRATSTNIARARRYLAVAGAKGSHRKAAGLRAALELPHSAGASRVVSLLSDGYLGSSTAVVRLVKRHKGSARIFAVGIGSSINRSLLEQVAHASRGAVAFVTLGDKGAGARIDRFYRRAFRPALADIRVDIPNATVTELYPRVLPDLVVGRPVTVVGRLRGATPRSVRLRGRVGDRQVSMTVPVVVRSGARVGLSKIWARAKLFELMVARPRSGSRLHREITQLARKHGILTSLTAFIAVDAASITSDGRGIDITIPLRMPEDVPKLR